VAGTCECVDELPGPIQCGEFLGVEGLLASQDRMDLVG